jgi:uncharacterized phage-like protein YoqJ
VSEKGIGDFGEESERLLEMIVAVSGHRPDKLPNKETGYKLPNPTYNYICRELDRVLTELKPEKAISGMALGTDQYFAFVCIKLGLPFIAAVPFLNQECKWPKKSQETYRKLLDKAAEVVIVSEGGYSPEKMQTRNIWMTDRCNKLIAIWDGSKGGTGNCVAYAQSINREIIYIDPRKANQ